MMVNSDLDFYSNGCFELGSLDTPCLYSASRFTGFGYFVNGVSLPFPLKNEDSLPVFRTIVGFKDLDDKKYPVLTSLDSLSYFIGNSSFYACSFNYFSSFSDSPLFCSYSDSVPLNYSASWAVCRIDDFFIFDGDDFSSVSVLSTFNSLNLAFEHCAFLYSSTSFYSDMVNPFVLVRIDSNGNMMFKNHMWGNASRIVVYGFIPYASFCYPDFSDIAELFGFSPSVSQATNLTNILSFLGVPYAYSFAINDYELIKEALRQFNTFLGGNSLYFPNDVLKSICHFLGADTAENDLERCVLFKDYVERISKMLKGEPNATL